MTDWSRTPKRVYDWVYRNTGRLSVTTEDEGESVELKASSAAYGCLQNVVAYEYDQGQTVHAAWNDGGIEVHLRVATGAPYTLLTAAGPAVSPAETMDMVLVRQQASKAWYVAVFDLDSTPSVETVRVEEREDDLRIFVETRHGLEIYDVRSGVITPGA